MNHTEFKDRLKNKEKKFDIVEAFSHLFKGQDKNKAEVDHVLSRIKKVESKLTEVETEFKSLLKTLKDETEL